jgi:hypothetical protein
MGRTPNAAATRFRQTQPTTMTGINPEPQGRLMNAVTRSNIRHAQATWRSRCDRRGLSDGPDGFFDMFRKVGYRDVRVGHC